MSITPVASLAQIEFACERLEEVGRLLSRLFNAVTVEDTFSAALCNEALAIRHFSLGEAMLQYCQPTMEVGMPHSELLARRGNCVHNLTWFVADINAAREACLAQGVPIALEFPMGEMIYSKLLPADNIVENDQAFIADALDVLGFRIELAEIPWRQTPPEPFICPTYSQPRPPGDDRLQPLEAINIVVPDLARARDLMAALFRGCRPGPIQQCGDVSGFSAVVGEAVLCFYQPSGQDHVLDRFLLQYGAGVQSLVYRTSDIATISAAAETENLALLADPGIAGWQQTGRSGMPLAGDCYMLETQQALGVTLVLCTE